MRGLSALLFGALFVCAPNATAQWQVTGRVGGSISAVAAQGSLLCVGVGSRLHFYDLADASSPREVGSTPSFGDSVLDVVVRGTRAYLATGTDGVHVLDISDPASPRVLGTWDSPGSAEGIAVDGTSLFVADGPFGLHVVDISNPAAPAFVASAAETTFAFDVAIHEGHAFVAAADAGLLVVDVGARDSPRELRVVNTPGFAREISISGSTLCLADQWGGVRIFSIAQPSSPREVSAVALPSWAFSVDLAGTTLHVAAGAHGLRTIDLSDPSRPREVGFFAIPVKVSWKVAALDGRAFIGVRSEGVRVVDVTDPASPREVAGILPMAEASSVAARGDFAYLLTADEGVRVIDLTEPGRPRQRGHAEVLQGAVGAIEVIGDRHLAVVTVSPATGKTQLDIFDVGDPDRPVRTASLPVFNIGRELVPRGSRLYMPDEFGLEVFDVSNPASPVFLGKITLTPDAGGAVTVAIREPYAFVAAARDGIQIVDVTDPANMQRVGAWLPEFGAVSQVAYRDGFLYATTDPSPELIILDARDPLHPVRIGSTPLGGIFSGDILLDGPYAFVANGGAGVAIVDVSDPAHPVRVAEVHVPGFAFELALQRSRILVASSSGGLVAVDRAQAGVTTTAAGFATVRPAKGRQSSPSRVDAAESAAPSAPRSIVVTSTADSGTGTLRDALANLAAGDVITFDPSVFMPSAPATIQVLTPLPYITQAGVVIDASNAGVILDGSRLSGSFDSGLEIGVSSKGNTIRGMQIMNFPSCGIMVHGNGGNIIGGDRSRGTGPTGEGNVLSRNRKSGIQVENPNQNRIVGNFIGTDATGRIPLGGQSWGVNLFYHAGNGTELSGDRVGGEAPWEGNVIAGNVLANVQLYNAGGHTVVGNFIGVDLSGSRAIDEAQSVGISASSDNVVTRNVMGGRASIIDQGACCNQLIDNWFGVTPDGRYLEHQLPADSGVVTHQSFNRITGNVFGGIRYSAVRVFGLGDRVSETIIDGNTFLGVTATQPIFGGGSLDVDGASRTFIGGTSEEFRNHINAGATGISMHPGVDRTFVLGNSIGNDDPGSMQNVDGIDARLSDFTFVQGNTIANNSGRGVIAGVVSTRIRRNSLHGNGNGAIESDAPSPPVILSVTSTLVTGMGCAGCTIEVFSDDESQARAYEGTTLADVDGRFTFSGRVRGPNVTATATTPAGMTSGLSAAAAAPPPPPRRRTTRR